MYVSKEYLEEIGGVEAAAARDKQKELKDIRTGATEKAQVKRMSDKMEKAYLNKAGPLEDKLIKARAQGSKAGRASAIKQMKPHTQKWSARSKKMVAALDKSKKGKIFRFLKKHGKKVLTK